MLLGRRVSGTEPSTPPSSSHNLVQLSVAFKKKGIKDYCHGGHGGSVGITVVLIKKHALDSVLT